MNELVSILIPVYNREAIIGETIHSALSQTYSNFEIIIFDNKSTDKTWDIIQKYSKKNNCIRAFQNEENVGPVRNWKKCIDEAKGVYGKILFSDDLISTDFIEKTVPFLKNNEIGFVFTSTTIFNDKIDINTLNYSIGNTGIYGSEKYINGALFEGGYPVSPGCAIFRTNDLKENLLLNIQNYSIKDFCSHGIGSDLLIYLLIANKYKYFAFVNKPLSFFRHHEGSISIKSADGKLPLFYMLAKSYFVENHRMDLIRRINTHIFFMLKLYNNNEYGLKYIRDFYSANNNYNLSFLELYKKAINIRIIKKILTIFFKRVFGEI